MTYPFETFYVSGTGRQPSRGFRTVLFAAALGAAALTGCGGPKDEAKKAASQVAARVNSDEITVHQINHALSRTPNVSPELADRVKTEILSRLIDQQLARQQAIEKKLDRSPAVQQAIEAARSEILARAYTEQIAAAQPRPTADETKRYYAEHPELFAQRRVYVLEEMNFVSDKPVGAELREQAKSRSMPDIAEWLKSKEIRYTANRGIRAAEQLPLEVLPKLQGAKNGEIVLVENGASHHVIRVAASRVEPVDEATATPRIQQYLSNRRAREAIDKELKQLKTGAKIEYLGEFAGDAAAAEAKAKTQAEAKAQALAAARAKADAEAQQRSDETTKARQAGETKARLETEAKARAEQSRSVEVPQKSLEKGFSGLR
jgi:EpsD family peptidyl-prolyl cis-trans isomerase